MSNTSDMQAFKVNGQVIVTELSQAEIVKNVARASALIKTMCGIGNNAAWACCLEAMDYIRQHPNYRHKVKKAFHDVMEAFKAYERKLIYTSKNRLFHLDDLTPEYRKRYAAITDREYYDYWASTGATAYMRKRQWVTNLWNKYRVSLVHHAMPNATITAWSMTACAALRLAQAIWENNVRVCVNEYKVPEPLLKELFGDLNLKAIADKWDSAITRLSPETIGYELESTEQKNIQNGLDQLMEEWTSVATMTDALAETTEAYDEVFRTKGEQQKALRLIADMRKEN